MNPPKKLGKNRVTSVGRIVTNRKHNYFGIVLRSGRISPLVLSSDKEFDNNFTWIHFVPPSSVGIGQQLPFIIANIRLL